MTTINILPDHITWALPSNLLIPGNLSLVLSTGKSTKLRYTSDAQDT